MESQDQWESFRHFGSCEFTTYNLPQATEDLACSAARDLDTPGYPFCCCGAKGTCGDYPATYLCGTVYVPTPADNNSQLASVVMTSGYTNSEDLSLSSPYQL